MVKINQTITPTLNRLKLLKSFVYFVHLHTNKIVVCCFLVVLLLQKYLYKYILYCTVQTYAKFNCNRGWKNTMKTK